MKALLARGANPNARMTQRLPGFAAGYTEPIGATPFFLASSVADVEIMRLLLAAGADPAQQTESNTTPLMAAAGVNRKLAESAVTEEQSLEAVKFLLELGADAQAMSRPTARMLSSGPRIADGTSWSSCWSTTARMSTP